VAGYLFVIIHYSIYKPAPAVHAVVGGGDRPGGGNSSRRTLPRLMGLAEFAKNIDFFRWKEDRVL
jgi:hypothetical protein